VTIDWKVVTGQNAQSWLIAVPHTQCLVHHDIFQPLQQLQKAASEQGFQLAIASAFRSFERQSLIWNSKANGQRPVLDTNGKALDITKLTQDELLFALLRWSAIPGCSRHHWGTDLDIYDAAAVAPNYTVQLTAEECAETGVFAKFHNWLDAFFASNETGFFRPYAQDIGGIAPERWHISHAPTAGKFSALLDENRLLDWLCGQNIALIDSIRTHWPLIFRRYLLLQPA
jgi:LAS superfamily LD-carboxypeptidase LdcB